MTLFVLTQITASRVHVRSRRPLLSRAPVADRLHLCVTKRAGGGCPLAPHRVTRCARAVVPQKSSAFSSRGARCR